MPHYKNHSYHVLFAFLASFHASRSLVLYIRSVSMSYIHVSRQKRQTSSFALFHMTSKNSAYDDAMCTCYFAPFWLKNINEIIKYCTTKTCIIRCRCKEISGVRLVLRVTPWVEILEGAQFHMMLKFLYSCAMLSVKCLVFFVIDISSL